MSQENAEVARRAFEAFNRTYAEGTPDLMQTFTDRNEAFKAAGLSE